MKKFFKKEFKKHGSHETLLTLLILSSLSIRVPAHYWVEHISGVTVLPISAWATGGYSGFGWICGYDDNEIWGIYVN